MPAGTVMPQAVLLHTLVWAQLLSQPLGTVQPLQRSSHCPWHWLPFQVTHRVLMGVTIYRLAPLTKPPQKLQTLLVHFQSFYHTNDQAQCDSCKSKPEEGQCLPQCRMSFWHSVSQDPSTTLLCWCREDTPRSKTQWLSSSPHTDEFHSRPWAALWSAGDVWHLTKPGTQLLSTFSSQCPQMLNQVKQLSKASPDHFIGISVHLTSWKTFYIGHNMAVTIQHYKSKSRKSISTRSLSQRDGSCNFTALTERNRIAYILHNISGKFQS